MVRISNLPALDTLEIVVGHCQASLLLFSRPNVSYCCWGADSDTGLWGVTVSSVGGKGKAKNI